MEEFKPLHATTRVVSSREDWTWRPESFLTFVEELAHASGAIQRSNHKVLHRGQRNCSWLIDSTIARNLQKNWLKMSVDEFFDAEARNSFDLHRLLHSALLWKFCYVLRPSQDLVAEEQSKPGIDSKFELMKRLQQYPHLVQDWEALPGTPLVDWSLSWQIGVFYANRHREPNHAGAVFLLDATETGKTQQTMKIDEILQIVARTLNDQSPGRPLFFCPAKQTHMLRANRQEARYFAQMDLRYDLSAIWRVHEQQIGKRLLLKIALPRGTNEAAKDWLDGLRLTEDFLMVDEQTFSVDTISQQNPDG